MPDPALLVGYATRDDAAVYDLGDGTAVISTTDFFMPIVDDAFDFGRIAAANALSDVYAMGGRPLMAIGILGWPVDTLPPELARRVLEGGRRACADAGVLLAGGHSIDNPEPIFGLAVTGRVPIASLKTNSGARSGDALYLTKPLGLGVLTTAIKRGKEIGEVADLVRDTMAALNTFGAIAAEHPWVHAMTDVTGFGLLGHLHEMCAGANVGARIDLPSVPRLVPGLVDTLIAGGCVPGGTRRNWDSYAAFASDMGDAERALMCDPQTSGGLLIAVAPDHEQAFEQLARAHGLELAVCGRFVPPGGPQIALI